jgi:hypothetical protein
MKRLIWTFAALCVAVVTSEAALIAQARPAEPPAAQAPVPPPIAVSPMEADASETRGQLRELLSKYPPDLGRILKLDPSLMRQPDYLAQYPGLTAFLAAHPEVHRNPNYYLEFVRQNYDYNEPPDPNRRGIAMWSDLMEAMSVTFAMIFVGLTLAWLVRTVLDHRRWLRISRVQTEVHNKLLDRFAGTSDLLTYIQTPAGQKFLEASPIPLDAPSKGIAAPISRMLWSLQIGVVLAVVGLGFQFISRSVLQEAAEGMWVIGILGLSFGIGFILSAVISYVLSRRLGLFEPSMPLGSERGDSTPA